MTTNAILNLSEAGDMATVNKRTPETSQWQSVLARDADQDGKFVFAVSSTGVTADRLARRDVRAVRMLRFFALQRTPKKPATVPACAAAPKPLVAIGKPK